MAQNIAEFEQYLQLLQEIKEVISQLIEVEQRKIDAVHKDDLLAVDECIRQEQAISLTMRSLESRRGQQLQQLGLAEVKLSGLAAAFPEELKAKAAEVAEQLQGRYQDYTSISTAARNALERGLREIERMMHPAPAQAAATGGEPRQGGLMQEAKLEGGAAKPPEAAAQPHKKLDFGA